jgi:peptidoglycan/xylan/chitin deacetylase (PgdA/CDA1 family)
MRFVSRSILLVVALSVVSGMACAAGPDSVAISDRSLWPGNLATPAAFDRASRAELLAFGHALDASESLDDATLAAELHLKKIDRASVDRLRAIWWRRLAGNYARASTACHAGEPFCASVHDVASFHAAARAFDAAPAPDYARWYEDASHFHRVYLDELLRLAALFPRISSEIGIFSAQETQDDGLADRQFLFSLDDGPTPAGGETDALLEVLRQHDLHPQYFALGAALKAREKATSAAALAQTYAGMCVGAHGWTHTSHSRRPDWKDSITNTFGLIQADMPQSYSAWFRPPYGQRRADSGAFFAANHIRVMLWNIDSQDWNRKISAAQARQRVLSLMLLWRHGVILFHDIHPKARVAIPWLLAQTSGSGVRWVDCHALSTAAGM